MARLREDERKSAMQLQLAVLRGMKRGGNRQFAYRSLELATMAWPTHRMTSAASTLAISPTLKFMASRGWIHKLHGPDGFTRYAITRKGLDIVECQE